MAETTPMLVGRTVYKCGDAAIVLEVPAHMSGTGYIPPPTIDFFYEGLRMPFAYVGPEEG